MPSLLFKSNHMVIHYFVKSSLNQSSFTDNIKFKQYQILNHTIVKEYIKI